MPHEWLLNLGYAEEINSDYRSKDQVRELKKKLRRHSDEEQCEIMHDNLRSRSYQDFLQHWHPTNLVLSSRRASQARIQKDLLKIHKERFPGHLVPVSYKPRDSRMQKKDVTVPETDITISNAVTHDKAWVPLAAVDKILSHPDWRLGYCMTVHSAQGLTVKETLWIIDQRLCWSNLIYTAVSRVEYAKQVRRAWGRSLRYDKPPENVAKENILKKLLRYKKHDEQRFGADAANGFDFCVDDIYTRNARCAKCNIPLLWHWTEPNDDQQFSVDRINNKKGHSRDNVRLTCLESGMRGKRYSEGTMSSSSLTNPRLGPSSR